MILKTKTFRLLWLIFLTAFFTTSCNKMDAEAEKTLTKNIRKSERQSKLTTIQENLLMEEFASLLSAVVRDDISVRTFLKAEAQKKFDMDYDILYHLIKNKPISNNETLRDKLQKYAGGESILSKIESQLPLVTIFVPQLPNGFSASTWDVGREIPAVSTGIITDGKVSLITEDGKRHLLDPSLIPGFPLLVVKNNERVKIKEKDDVSYAVTGGGNSLVSDIFNYEFLSDSFNGSIVTKPTNNIDVANYECLNCTPPAKVVTAYNLWAYSYPNDNLWQRDYIYYSISPTSVNGPLDPSFQEHLTGLKFNTGTQAYNKITDQNDPYINQASASWTEGSYEFSLTALINSTSGLGASIIKYFPIYGGDLFHVTYTRVDMGTFYMYKINTIEPKQYILPTPLPIASWDIKNNAMSWKIILSEVDPSQTYTHQHSVSTQFAANFGIDGTLLKKIGLKFGASMNTTNTNTYTLVTQMDDDQLGEAAIYFYDPILIWDDIIPNQGPSYTFKDFDTGWAKLVIQPLTVF